MKNFNAILAPLSLILVLGTFISTTSVAVNAGLAPYNSCVLQTNWQASTATTSSPIATAIKVDTSNVTSKLLQAIRGTDNRIYTRVASVVPYAQTNWSAWKEGNGITVKSEPEITEFQQDFNADGSAVFFMSAYGTDNGLYTRKSSDGITWTAWQRYGAITLKAKPTVSKILVSNGELGQFSGEKLLQTGYGTDNGLYTRISNNGSTWTEWVRGGAITLASRVEQVDYSSKIFQFARGTDNGLYSRNTSNQDGLNWTAWIRNSGGITVLDETSTTPYDFVGGGQLQQVVRGTDTGIYFRRSTDGTTWSGWARLGSLNFAEKPSLTSAFTGFGSDCGYVSAMHLSARGFDNRLYSVENININSANFGFSSGLNWTLDTGITLNNNINEIDFTPSFGSNGAVQSARGTDNRVYTRIFSTSPIG